MVDLVAIIRKIEQEKTESKKHPVLALESDIMRYYTKECLASEISRLIGAGMITEGRTINERYFKIAEKD